MTDDAMFAPLNTEDIANAASAPDPTTSKVTPIIPVPDDAPPCQWRHPSLARRSRDGPTMTLTVGSSATRRASSMLRPVIGRRMCIRSPIAGSMARRANITRGVLAACRHHAPYIAWPT